MKIILLPGLGFGNGLGDLTFLLTFGVVTLGPGEGDDVWRVGVLELAVGSFLAVELETGAAEIGEELADLAGHRWMGSSVGLGVGCGGKGLEGLATGRLREAGVAGAD